MSNVLSYSRVRLYTECPKKYEYHYVQKIRERTKSGALFFGSAIDKAIESLLKNPTFNAQELFDANWSRSEINGHSVSLRDSLQVVYAATDFDADLLTAEDWQTLDILKQELFPTTNQSVLETYKACAASKIQRIYRQYTEEENRFLNACNWYSLRQKGHLMLRAFQDKVVWRIKEVLSTQEKITLGNGSDSLIGFIDLVCIWEDDQPTIIDFKTSSIEYAKDSPQTSPQLAIYAHAKGIKRAGFIVFRKQIVKNKVKMCTVCAGDGTGSRHRTCNGTGPEGKRCGGAWKETLSPECVVQMLIDDVPERTDEIVINNLDDVNRLIQTGIYPRNFNACEMGYGTCGYKALCYKNDMTNLEKVKE